MSKIATESVKPYDARGAKGEQVEEMFDSIAPAYDFMNTAMTFGLHRRWLSKALAALPKPQDDGHRPAIIDLATGTGDVAFRLAGLYPTAEIVGVDLSEGMLKVARRKAQTFNEQQGDSGPKISFEQGDCMNLRFDDDTFDALTIAYGVRNFEDLQRGFREFHRVLRPGGALMVLELSRPENPLTRPFYDLYARGVIPLIGRMVSKDRRAYTYLPQSIAAMPPRARLAEMLCEAGFRDVHFHPLTMGVVTFYIAEK